MVTACPPDNGNHRHPLPCVTHPPQPSPLPCLTHPPPTRCPRRVPRRDHRAPSAPAAVMQRSFGGAAAAAAPCAAPPVPGSATSRSHPGRQLRAPACSFPPPRKDPVQQPSRRSKGARGEPRAAPGARRPHAAGMEPGRAKRSWEWGGVGVVPNPRHRGRVGGSLTQQQPAGARGAQERGEHPCGAARSVQPRTAARSRRAPGPPRPARSPSIGRYF